MRLVLPARRTKRRPNYRLRSALVETACLAFAAVLVIWSLVPVYNMVLIALSEHSAVFSGEIFPWDPSFHSFYVVLTQGFWYLERFWHQFGNSIFIGLMTMFLTLLIGTLASFTIGRMRIRHGWLLTNAALLTYVIPASFLAIPFYRIMQNYGLSNNPWSVIAAMVTFAAPYAIFIFQQYGKSIPLELDEFGAHRRRLAAAGVFPHLPAIDGARAGRRWDLCTAAGVERIPVPVPAVVVEEQHDGIGGAGTVHEQRRGTVELYDGHGHHIRDSADRDLLRVPPPHGRRPDRGRCQRVVASAKLQYRAHGRPPLAHMRGADRVQKCLLFGVDRTNRRQVLNDANDPNRTFNGLLKPRRRSVWETRLLQRSNP